MSPLESLQMFVSVLIFTALVMLPILVAIWWLDEHTAPVRDRVALWLERFDTL